MPIEGIIKTVTEISKETIKEMSKETKNMLKQLDEPLNNSDVTDSMDMDESGFKKQLSELDKPLNDSSDLMEISESDIDGNEVVEKGLESNDENPDVAKIDAIKDLYENGAIQDKSYDSDDTNKEGENGTEKKVEKHDSNSYTVIDGEKYRTDDKGNIYQKRNKETGTYECLPNTQYELNGYSYRTDSHGRIIRAEGTLKEKNHNGRPTINDNVKGMKEKDEKGHLIGDQFEGSNLNGNLVAMDFDVNRSDYKKLEEKLSKYVNEEHKNVTMKIDVNYEGNSNRPTSFTAKYTVDGEIFKEKFNN